MKKVIRDGKVAVLYSPGYGAGWFTWNRNYPELVFHPILVDMVENNRQEEITDEFVEDLLKELGVECDYIFTRGADDLRIGWVTEGEQFDITEYDGSESINIISENSYLTA